MREDRALYRSKAWRVLRLRALDRDGWRCSECGRAGKLEVHHVVPVRDGGERLPPLSGLRTLCRTCHLGKHPRRRQRPESERRRRWRELVDALI